ncbi:MAG: thiazole synthase [Deltaproteobacteria bacterium]|nr:thiazole synthase [Deltaproteobacteria bacterium]
MDKLKISGIEFESRLLLGTGKFSSFDVMKTALEASGAQMVTVALRRVDLAHPEKDILRFIDKNRYRLLPNTSGAKNALEAVRLARLAKEAGLGTWLKLEVIPDPRWLLPDGAETLKAAAQLIQEGFTVLPYIQADPILAKQLAEAGCAAVMPLGSWIGSARGLKTKEALEIIIEQATVPVVVDAGLGVPSHAAEAMEMGADAVLVNTAIATAEDPVGMARAFRLGVEAGRLACLAGRAEKKNWAEASSPTEWTKDNGQWTVDQKQKGSLVPGP